MNWNATSWFDGSGNPCTYDIILSSNSENSKNHEIQIGSASQPHKDSTLFAVVLLRNVGESKIEEERVMDSKRE